eukprot:sb/3477415/
MLWDPILPITLISYNFTEVRGKAHKDWGPAADRLALYALLDLQLVPEHIEMRTLYNPLRPEMPQGVVEMFVDIFDKTRPIPPPIDITPRAPQDHGNHLVTNNHGNHST